MPSLPLVSSYKPQSKRTRMGNGRGTGVARPIDKKKRSKSDSSDSSGYQKETCPSKKCKDESSLALDCLESDSESDSDFNPTVKEWLATNVQKTMGAEANDSKNSAISSHERKEIDGHSVTGKGRTANKINGNRKGQDKTLSKPTTNSKNGGHDVGARKIVAPNQNNSGARHKNGERLDEHLD